MIALLRAEFRKLLSIRSTYIISGIALLLIGFIAFYVAGYKGVGASSHWLMGIVSEVSTILAIFTSLIAILFMGHEYRYNTIMYTLTAANSRTKVLLAKVIVTVLFSFGLMAASVLLATLAYWMGVLFSPSFGRMILAPEFFWGDIWQAVYYLLAYSLVGLLFAFLFRHLVGAIAAVFIVPTIEGLLSMLLKDNTKYLPLSSLEQVHTQSLWSPGKAALLFTIYLVAAWVITWFLFLKRDAN
jgi:ABC-type transport system involved in multi-copper enzyme maturation permease subunit